MKTIINNANTPNIAKVILIPKDSFTCLTGASPSTVCGPPPNAAGLLPKSLIASELTLRPPFFLGGVRSFPKLPAGAASLPSADSVSAGSAAAAGLAAGLGAGLGAGMALGNTMAQNIQETSAPKEEKSKADQLRELKALLDEGILTQEEFDAEKKIILVR